MASVKAKTTSKLKVGQKKNVNKWLIIGGVAAIAIIGAVVVRFSSASTWRVVKKQTFGYSSRDFRATQATMSLAANKTYRICFSGRAVSKKSIVVIQPQGFYTAPTVNPTTGNKPYCSKSYKGQSGVSSKFTPYVSARTGEVYVQTITFERLD